MTVDQTSAKATAARGRANGSHPGPQSDRKVTIRCPVCGKPKGDITPKPGGGFWLGCRACEGAGISRGDWLCAVAKEVGAPAGSVLLDHPWRYLAAYAASSPGPAGRKEARLPSPETIAGAAARLRATPKALAYLIDVRGISRAVLERFAVGYGENPFGQLALLFPMRNAAGAIVAAKWRFPYAGAQMRSWPGRRVWPLYPQPEPEWTWLLLCAGELDALRCRTAGLPATSVTLGAGYWSDAWTEALRPYRRVVLAFDNNEEAQAQRCARRLREVGVRAVRLDLRAFGLRTPKGDLSDYLNRGGSPDAIERAAFSSHTRVIRKGTVQ